jgi:hypothetical protein
MKARTLLSLTLLGLLAAATLAAADVTGKWTAQVPGRGGELRTTTFVFKQDGSQLTGTMTSFDREIPIENGKVEGDQISFTVTLSFGGNEMKFLYKGTVSGNEIKFTRQREGGGQAREFVAKRAES